MSVAIIFNTLFVWPIRALVEFLFVLFQVILRDEPGLSIIFLSLVVNSALLPIYLVADRWQQDERDLRERMKGKLADIKAVFKGDERQMIVNAYHRQMGYTPLKALKSSVGVLLQIPFFIAAYQFLSHTPSLRGESFLFLEDLGAADGLFKIGGFSINAMPILMTAINIASSLVYTRGIGWKERIQLLAMSLLFLVLLYDSPSGLVLYWTVNNLFSLGKNLAVTYLERPGKVLQWTVSVAATLLAAAMIAGGAFLKPLYRYSLIAACVFCVAAPYAWRFLFRSEEEGGPASAEDRSVYFLSWATLLALTGILIPAQVIASSPTEFDSPWRFILFSLLQGLAACLFLPGLVWAFAGRKLQRLLPPIAVILAATGLVSVFALSGNYGTLTRGFLFDNPNLLRSAFPLWLNLAVAAGAILSTVILFKVKKQRLLTLFFSAAIAAVVLTAGVDIYGTGHELASAAGDSTKGSPGPDEDALFKFSRTGNNTFVLFLDRAIGVAFYHAIDLLPETVSEMDGFVWYPKTISFGDCTILGVPTILGGYDYAPWNVNARVDAPLVAKINEALTMLPKLYGEAGKRVVITDPSLANMRWVPDTSIYDGIPNVTARNIKGLFAKRYLKEQGYPPEKTTEAFDYDIVYRFALFRVSLPALRYVIYYNGGWWRDGRSNSFDRSLAVFPNLYYLSDLCAVDDGADSLSIFMNESTHEYGAFSTAFMPSRDPIRYGEADEKRFGSQGAAGYAYAYLASLRAIGTWLEELKELGVYDNTKIIIVADHGGRFPNDKFEVESLERYNPLLLVKERRASGPLKISDDFMTIADVPSLLVSDLGGAANPYTGHPISSDPKRGPLRVYEAPGSQNRHGPVGFTLRASRTLRGGDIYRADAWGEIEE